ncbi:hypothetical protein RHMOL_Rhmol10G0226900 [Rhododendron molle]|uniref:Uncharacterized protein n=1 Tax=Rhododendron molle TaxID=49168 RepID=A0ACC0M660_RHOML|nr:hypothetical protein RHMOL_Rhmol10G0226900 [Rhododendron molle]
MKRKSLGSSHATHANPKLQEPPLLETMAKTDHIHMAETNEEKPATQAEEEQNNPKKHKKTKKNTNKEEEEIRVKIETLGENPNKASPFVGYFPSGFDTLKNQADGPTVRVFRHEKWTKRLQLVVSPSKGSQVDFVGTNYSGEATAPQLCTYALGVLDKQLQTLKIVPIASNKIFRLEPRVRGLELSVKEPSKEELTTEKKYVKLRDTIGKFGTKKERKRMMEWESLHRKEDPEAQEALGKKFEGVKINKEALESADEVEKKRLACVFSYINHLIKFKDKHSREGFSSAQHHKIPSILSQKFSTMFGGLDREWLVDEERDLLIRYVLVLTLIADGFTTALSDIAKDLRMHKNTVREHFEQLGCKLMSENKVWLATLSLPLEFPKPKYKRKKKVD